VYTLLTQAHCMLFRDSLHSRAEARQFNYRNTSNMSGNITNQISEPQDDILTQTSTNKNTLAHTGPMRTYRCQLTGNMHMQDAFKLNGASETAAEAVHCNMALSRCALSLSLSLSVSPSLTHIRAWVAMTEKLRSTSNNNN